MRLIAREGFQLSTPMSTMVQQQLTLFIVFRTQSNLGNPFVPGLIFFYESLKDDVVPFTVANENLTERSFGFTVKKSHSRLQTQPNTHVSGPSGIGRDNEPRNPLFGQMSGSDESDDEPVLKKRKMFQQICEDDSSEDEAGVGAGIGFLKHAADVGDCCPCL